MISDDLLNELHVVGTLELNLNFYEQHSVFFICIFFLYGICVKVLFGYVKLFLHKLNMKAYL